MGMFGRRAGGREIYDALGRWWLGLLLSFIFVSLSIFLTWVGIKSWVGAFAGLKVYVLIRFRSMRYFVGTRS